MTDQLPRKENIHMHGKRIFAMLLVLVFLAMGTGTPVRAADDTDYVTGNTSYRLPVPKAYVVQDAINNIGEYGEETLYLKDPQDLFIDKRDNLYIVDTGNSRVIRMNLDLVTTGVFYGPEDKPFSSPEGVFVDDDGDIYVADTGNSRIVHMDASGNQVEIFTNPESDATSSSPFNPSKLIVSPTGYIYVVRGETIMAIDGNNGFRGLYGQTNIGYSLTEAMIRLFASESQQKFMQKRLASSYINLALGVDGMIYATSMEREEGEIKELNSIGNNVYRKYKTVGNSIKNPITNFIEKKVLKSVVAGTSFRFGEYFDDDGNYMEPVFRDIAVDRDGIVTVIEELNGKVYQYDQEGNMLVAFGGLGEQKGKFSRPSSIAVNSSGLLFIADRLNNNIQIFKPTEFIGLVHQATTAYSNGDYTASYELWKEVLEIHENYELAHLGIAKTYYKQGQWKASMDESKIAGNRDVYTKSFDEYKYQVLRDHFVLIVVIVLVIIAAVFGFLALSIKGAKREQWAFINDKSRKMGLWRGVKYSYNVLIHPIDTLEGIRYNKTRLNMAVPFLILAAAYVVRIAYLYIVHYPLASIEIADANPVFEAVKLFIVPITFVPAAFAATSISDGESKFHEIFFVSALSMVPYILINTPLMFLSNILSKSQQSWYGIFSALAYVWMFLILFAGMKILNNYTFGKTIRMMIVTMFMMLIIWLVCGLFYVLLARLIQFILGVAKEFRISVL